MPRSRRVPFCAFAVVGVVACGSSHDSPTQPAQAVQGIKAVAGGSITDTVLSAPPQALVVEVRGPGGALAKGSMVRFSVQASTDTTRQYENTLYVCSLPVATCGPVSGYYASQTANVSTDTVDANGHAKALLRFGTVTGPTYVIVSAPEFGMKDSVPFTVTAGAAKSVVLATHDVPLLLKGRATLRASVTDAYRNPRSDAVTFTLGTTPGVATLEAASATVAAVDVGAVYAFARAGAAVDSALVRVVPPGRLVVWDAGYTAVRMVNTDGSAPRTLATDAVTNVGVFPRFSADGGTVAFQVGSNASNTYPTRLATTDSLGTGRRDIGLPAGVTAISSPQPLADGTVRFVGWALAANGAASATMSVYSVAPDGGVTKIATLPAAASGYGAVSFSRDGSRVAYVAQGAGLQAFTIATGQNVVIDPAGTSPVWSPSGDKLAYLVWGGAYYAPRDGTITVANADGSNRVSITGGATFSPGLAWSPDGAYLMGRSGLLKAVRVRDGATVPLNLPVLGRTAPGVLGDYYQPDWR